MPIKIGRFAYARRQIYPLQGILLAAKDNDGVCERLVLQGKSCEQRFCLVDSEISNGAVEIKVGVPRGLSGL